jgi:hypothetical protein
MITIVMTDDADAGKQIAKKVEGALGLRTIDRAGLERSVAERLCMQGRMLPRAFNFRLAKWILGDRFERACMEEVCELARRDGLLIETAVIAPSLRLIGHVMCVHICAADLELDDFTHPAEWRVPARWRPRLRRSTRCGTQLELYDLVLNSVRIPPSQCAEHVLRLAASAKFRSTKASRTSLSGARQSVQSNHRPSAAVRNPRSGWAVTVGLDHLWLAGAETTEQQIAVIEDHLRGCKGDDRPGWLRPPARLWG